jgi:DNA-binding transcriptional MerR regulator
LTVARLAVNTLPMDDGLLELAELCEQTGVTARTVRYYIQQGLLASPGQMGPGAKYTPSHLARLLLIRKLQQEHLPLAEIRRRLTNLDDESVLSLVRSPARAGSAADYARSVLGQSARPGKGPTTAVAAPSKPAFASDRSTWERIVLSPDVELHIRRPLTREDNRRIEQVLEFARRTLNAGS